MSTRLGSLHCRLPGIPVLADNETQSTQKDTVSLELTLKYIRLKDGFEAKH